MYDNINVLYNIIENVGGSKVPNDSHGEQLPKFFSTGFHLIGFELGPRCPSDLDPTFEENVYDVGTYKTCGARDENVAGRRVIPLLGPDLVDPKGMILTEEQTTSCYNSM